MSTESIQKKPVSPPAPKPVAAPVSTQDNSAFAARMKKNNVEQGKSTRSGRRDEEKLPSHAMRCDEDQINALQTMSVVTAAARRENDGEDGENNSWTSVGFSDEVDGFDTEPLAEKLAPLSANDGLFEVLLPNGKRLSVAVTSTANRLRFLLSSDSDDLCAQIKRKKKELEQRIGRRTGKDVILSVL
ncbi:MAG: hypothetical protein ACI8WM_003441 [Burkholderiaceae bacterium]|jgi:hypothetical protein